MSKRPMITNQVAARIREMRAANKSYMQIAMALNVSVSTAMRYGSEHHAEMQRKHQRDRYYRNKQKALSNEPR